MSEPSSFCTITTKQTIPEFLGWLLSLSIHHPNTDVFIMCDDSSKKAFDDMIPVPTLKINWKITLNEYTNKNRATMEKLNIWSTFQMSKADVIAFALEFNPDTLFMDCDTLLLGKINDIDKTKQLGVSDQYIKNEYVVKYGTFNGGFLWTNNIKVVSDWKKFTLTSRYYDQASIENLVDTYESFVIPENYNIQSWRFVIGVETKEQHHRKVTVRNSKVFYNNLEIKFLHTHFNDNNDFNIFFINKLKEAKRYKELMIIYYIINRKWIIRIPKQPQRGLWHHDNNSYRELLTLIPSITIKYDTNVKNCILEPNIVLYDRPTLEWINDECITSSLILLGNGSIDVEGDILKTRGCNVKPWIFWPRKPSILEKRLVKKYEERTINVIFIGKYENSVQEKFRKNNWNGVIDKWHLIEGTKDMFTQEQYLENLSNSLYGLCLRGYGSKCHREIELMALGCIPLITPDVSLSYADPLIEGIHYCSIKTPDDIKNINKTKEEWTVMSNACRAWYVKNVHSQNTMRTTLENILYN